MYVTWKIIQVLVSFSVFLFLVGGVGRAGYFVFISCSSQQRSGQEKRDLGMTWNRDPVAVTWYTSWTLGHHDVPAFLSFSICPKLLWQDLFGNENYFLKHMLKQQVDLWVLPQHSGDICVRSICNSRSVVRNLTCNPLKWWNLFEQPVQPKREFIK